MPILGKRKAQDIKRKDITDLLDGIAHLGAPVMANRTLTLVKRLFQLDP